MELNSTPTPDETDSKAKESKKASKKKKAGIIGAFAIEPKQDNVSDETSRRSLWRKTKSEKTDKTSPITPKKTTTHEADESTTNLEYLSEDEREYALQKIVTESEFESPLTDQNEEQVHLADQAIARFRESITSLGEDLETALSKTLRFLGVDSLNEGIVEPDPVGKAEQMVAIEKSHEHANEDTTVSDEPTEFGDALVHLNERDEAEADSEKQIHEPLRSKVLLEKKHTETTPVVRGVTDYLMGQRRNRIAAEKDVAPLHIKLQKQVAEMQVQIRHKEIQIRRIAAQQVETSKLIDAIRADKPYKENMMQKLAPVPAMKFYDKIPKTERLARPSPVKEVVELEQSRDSSYEKPKRTPKAEAPGHIGQMVITAESHPKAVSKKIEKIPPPARLTTEKRVETLSRQELLLMSEKVIVDGTSLRQIYETRLVGEKGLRRLVREHLKGGDIKKALRREIVEREIDFERDPLMRDQVQHHQAPKISGNQPKTLQQLLAQADKVAGYDKEEVAFLKARADFEAREQIRDQHKRRTMDISLVSTIVILLSFVLFLMLRG